MQGEAFDYLKALMSAHPRNSSFDIPYSLRAIVHALLIEPCVSCVCSGNFISSSTDLFLFQSSAVTGHLFSLQVNYTLAV